MRLFLTAISSLVKISHTPFLLPAALLDLVDPTAYCDYIGLERSNTNGLSGHPLPLETSYHVPLIGDHVNLALMVKGQSTWAGLVLLHAAGGRERSIWQGGARIITEREACQLVIVYAYSSSSPRATAKLNQSRPFGERNPVEERRNKTSRRGESSRARQGRHSC